MKQSRAEASTILQLKAPQLKRSTKRLNTILAGKSIMSDSINASVQAQSLQLQRKPKAKRASRKDCLHNSEGLGETSPTLDLHKITAPRPSDCANPKWTIVDCVHDNHLVIPVRCGRCPGCQNHWRKKVKAMVFDGSHGQETWFVTLTLPEYPSQMEENRYDLAQKRWHSFLRLAHKLNVAFEFFRVVELQRRGTPHFHLAINRVKVNARLITNTKHVQLVFRNLARKTGFGWLLDKTLYVERTRLGGKGAASYMGKYLAKQTQNLARPDGRLIRRYCRSKNWCQRPKTNVFRFRRIGEILDKEPYVAPMPCSCGDGHILLPNQQAVKWLAKCVNSDTWVAPMALFDYLHGI